MSDSVISCEGLGKAYRIGRQESRERYTALRDVLAGSARRLLQRTKQLARGEFDLTNDQSEEFWALKDVSFEVKQGEVLGIIGRNGAGKSTLLKVLSRITEPSAGRVTLRGRVASLLEVGTGFHPELTGRENIFLNGAILGMTRGEIKRKFDEIVAFAEVEKFLDTPVKRFSSGMYVRLAFAVAAHLEPEILVVDEVLAVGDAEFQKKCLGKMQDVSRGGRTVLFVSHNMAAIVSLCNRGIWLDRGQLAFDGNGGDAVKAYAEGSRGFAEPVQHAKLSNILSLGKISIVPQQIEAGSNAEIALDIYATADDVISDLALLIHVPDGQRIALIDLRSPKGPLQIAASSRLEIRVNVGYLPFVENEFEVGLYINSASVCKSFMQLATFGILPNSFDGGVTRRDPQFRGFVELPVSVSHLISCSEKRAPEVSSNGAVRSDSIIKD
jgi:lipopolysaccharide transport system ATP-binding protein